MPPKKQAKPTADELAAATLDALTTLAGEMKALGSRIESVEAAQGPETATQQIAKVTGQKVPVKEEEVDETIEEKKLHPKHRKLVDEILGEQFNAWETYDDTNSTNFRFHIQIPADLSSVPKATHERAGCDHDEEVCKVPPDIRSKAVSLAEGENGVKNWCLKVRKNLEKFYTSNAISSPFTTAAL